MKICSKIHATNDQQEIVANFLLISLVNIKGIDLLDPY